MTPCYGAFAVTIAGAREWNASVARCSPVGPGSSPLERSDLGHASIQSTKIYLRSDPIGKLDVLAARLPPAIRKGSFKEAPDRLLAILKDARGQ